MHIPDGFLDAKTFGTLYGVSAVAVGFSIFRLKKVLGEKQVPLIGVVSAFVFAAYYVLIKYIFLHQPFLGSYVWTRLGSFLGALFLIVPRRNWDIIFEPQRKTEAIKNLPLFLGIRLLAGIGFILLNYALSFGNVALINALQGIQYVFLIFIVLFLSESYPGILKEEMNRAVLAQKLIGGILVGVGLYLLM